MKISDSEFKRIMDFCKEKGASIERWPSYYERRYLEFLSYYALFPQKQLGLVLELGCGIGYQSAFLSKVASNVIATDLEEESVSSHAPGMLRAKELHQNLNISNVMLKACSAEELPFDDNSFDMVYSSHVLEHIPNPERALREIYRVLKPGGINFCVVPTRADKVYAFFNFYSYLIYMTFSKLKKKIVSMFRQEKNVVKIPSEKLPVTKGWLSDFPFPPPHGHYKHYLEELKTWTPVQWKNRCLKAAPFQLESQCTTQFNPLLSLLGAFVPKWGTKMHELTRKAELKYGKKAFFRAIGLNTVLILKK